MTRIGLAIAAALMLSASPLAAGAAELICQPDPRVAPAAAQWLAKTPFQAMEPMNTEQARCFKLTFVKALQPRLGKTVGYKVGLYSKAARAAYKTETPRFGYLLEKTLLPSGANLALDYAIVGTWESDLLLVVKDDNINTAQTREALYAGLRGYRPFIELPDRSYAPGAVIDADDIEALNVGARAGVMGAEVALPQTPEAMAGLVDFSVEVSTVGGAAAPRVETGKAIDTLGDVIEIVRFARDQLLAEGGRLKAGDLISIGVVTPTRAPLAGQILTIRYRVLPAVADVSVNFR